ncbi:hypothetical protein ACQ4M4_05200 [Leptolyngbya sp. AN02str]|uniref:hypothetical protein n=1 Tax=Leptolyngbya sp. AN02str TaxID=3423363 RepID=UPI003D3244D9
MAGAGALRAIGPLLRRGIPKAATRAVGNPPIAPSVATGGVPPMSAFTQQSAINSFRNSYHAASAVRPPTPSQARAIGQLERTLGQPAAVRPPINQSASAPRTQVGARQKLQQAFNSPSARRPGGVPSNRGVGGRLAGASAAVKNQAGRLGRAVSPYVGPAVSVLGAISGVSDIADAFGRIRQNVDNILQILNPSKSFEDDSTPQPLPLHPTGGVPNGSYTLRFFDPSYFSAGVSLDFELFGPVSNYRIIPQVDGYNVYARARKTPDGVLEEICLTCPFTVPNLTPQNTFFDLIKNFPEPDAPVLDPNAPTPQPTVAPTPANPFNPILVPQLSPVFLPSATPGTRPGITPFFNPSGVPYPTQFPNLTPFGRPSPSTKPRISPGLPGGIPQLIGSPNSTTSRSSTPQTSTSTFRGGINEVGTSTNTCNPCPDPCPEPTDYTARFDVLERKINFLDRKLNEVLDILRSQRQSNTISSELAWKNPENLQDERIQFTGEGLQGIHLQLNAVQELLKQLAHADSRAWRSYRILGGDEWFFEREEDEVNPYREYQPEQSLFYERSKRFLRDENPDDPLDRGYEENAGSLPLFLIHHLTVLYDRLGLHRFPAEVPDSLTSEENDPDTGNPKLANIADQATFHEWQLRQLDAILGEFPIKIKYKDGEGKDQLIDLPNLAESQAEIIGLLLNVAADAEIGTQLGFSATTEAIRANMSATNSADFARAIADYLGFRYKETSRDVKLSITPGANNIRDSLKPGTLKGQKIEYDEKSDFQGDLKRLIIGTEIIKAAFYRPFRGSDDELPGEGIRKDLEVDPSDVETDSDRKWREFLEQLENPQGSWARDAGAPKPDLRNIQPRDRKDEEYPPNTTGSR